MGYFKIRRALAVGGGSVQIGADCNLYRNAASVLKTDDGLTIGGTPFVVPYATTSPTVATNGQVGFVQKTNRTYLTFYCGGTPFHVMFPQTTHGTITVTVGGTP